MQQSHKTPLPIYGITLTDSSKHTLIDGRNDLGSFEKVLQLPNTEVSHTNRLHQTLCYYGLHSLGGGVVQGTQVGGTAGY